MKKLFTLFFVLINFSVNIISFAQQWVTHHNPVYHGNIPKPETGIQITDPHFGTQIVRITNALSSQLPGIIPNYSKRQAWNVGETYLILQTGSGVFRLYNGESPYQFIKTLQGVEGEDVFWHPSDPNTIIYNDGNTLYSYNVSAGQSTLIKTFSPYLYANTRGEGNLSADGRYYAFVGRMTDSTFNSLNVYDFTTNSIVSTFQLPANIEDLDWVSISPSGNYVIVDYADNIQGRYHGVEVYSRSFNFLWQKPLGAGHSDIGTDAYGNEVLVMAYYDGDSNKTYIKKFLISNGQETVLLGLSYLFDLHISCRNEQQKNYCFISTFDYVGRLTADSSSWLSFENEVFALKLDGSGQVARIAHHHSRRFSPITPDPDSSIYWAEPHATVSREGKRILWGSNWEQNVQSDTSCDTYICNFRNFPPLAIKSLPSEEIPKSFYLYQNYPNPFNFMTKIKFDLSQSGLVTLKVYNTLGCEIITLINERLLPGAYETIFNSSMFSSGIYFYKLITEKFFQTRKMIIIQ